MEMMKLFDEEEKSEFDIAWHNRDWEALQKLSDTFKEKNENELFDIINALSSSKIYRDVSQSDSYNKFMIDTALSQHVDCMIAVNTMNMFGEGLSDQHHFNYYFHAISQGKRYGKWAKLTQNASEMFILKLLMLYYSINADDAVMYKKTLEAKGNMPAVLHNMKALVTDDFIKGIVKNVKEQKELKKLALEW